MIHIFNQLHIGHDVILDGLQDPPTLLTIKAIGGKINHQYKKIKIKIKKKSKEKA